MWGTVLNFGVSVLGAPLLAKAGRALTRWYFNDGGYLGTIKGFFAEEHVGGNVYKFAFDHPELVVAGVQATYNGINNYFNSNTASADVIADKKEEVFMADNVMSGYVVVGKDYNEAHELYTPSFAGKRAQEAEVAPVNNQNFLAALERRQKNVM